MIFDVRTASHDSDSTPVYLNDPDSEDDIPSTDDSDAVRVPEFNRGSSGGNVNDAHQEGTGSFSATLLRREELIPDSMRKTTLANLETSTQMRMQRFLIGCHTSRSTFTRKSIPS